MAQGNEKHMFDRIDSEPIEIMNEFPSYSRKEEKEDSNKDNSYMEIIKNGSTP